MAKQQQKYFIGPSLLGDIRATITRVDAIAPKTSGAEQPVRLQSLHQPSSARLRLGKTTATWTKGTLATIPLWEEGTAPNETASGTSLEGCVNKFATVQTNKWVGMLRGPGGKHYLIAAEC